MAETENLADLERAEQLFEVGRQAFENGLYGRSRDLLLEASQLVSRNSAFGGEVQLWLVTAYQAGGQQTEAIALCETLERHPDYKTRKQAKRLIYILRAPELKRPKEWMTEIPDLTGLDDGESDRGGGTRYVSAGGSARPVEKKPPQPVDLSQVETADNGFVWIALGAIGLVIVGLIGLS